MLELTEELEEMKNSQQDSKILSALKKPMKISESYMMLKEDLLLKLFQMKKLNLNYAELNQSQLDQIKFHTLLPMMVEQLDSHILKLKLMIQLKLILPQVQSSTSLNSKLVMLSLPHQETTLEELVLL